MNEKIQKFEESILKIPEHKILKITGNLASKFKNKEFNYKYPDFFNFSKKFKKRFNESLKNKNIIVTDEGKYISKISDNTIPSSTIKGLFHCFYYHNKGKHENELFGSSWDKNTKNHVDSEKKGCLIFFDGFIEKIIENNKQVYPTTIYIACKINNDINIQEELELFFKSKNLFKKNKKKFKNLLNGGFEIIDITNEVK